MTNFINNNKQKIETQFTHFVGNDDVNPTDRTPSDYDNVELIGTSGYYGSVFKAWNNNTLMDFTLFYGIAGNEF